MWFRGFQSPRTQELLNSWLMLLLKQASGFEARFIDSLMSPEHAKMLLPTQSCVYAIDFFKPKTKTKYTHRVTFHL